MDIPGIYVAADAIFPAYHLTDFFQKVAIHCLLKSDNGIRDAYNFPFSGLWRRKYCFLNFVGIKYFLFRLSDMASNFSHRSILRIFEIRTFLSRDLSDRPACNRAPHCCRLKRFTNIF